MVFCSQISVEKLLLYLYSCSFPVQNAVQTLLDGTAYRFWRVFTNTIIELNAKKLKEDVKKKKKQKMFYTRWFRKPFTWKIALVGTRHLEFLQVIIEGSVSVYMTFNFMKYFTVFGLLYARFWNNREINFFGIQ